MQGLLSSNFDALIFFAGLVWLQVLLSKKKNRLFGLLIPIGLFAYSVYLVYAAVGLGLSFSLETLGTLVLSILFLNIPSLILLLIYRYYRNKGEEEDTIDFHLQKYL